MRTQMVVVPRVAGYIESHLEEKLTSNMDV